jgi:hypothetical protein
VAQTCDAIVLRIRRVRGHVRRWNHPEQCPPVTDDRASNEGPNVPDSNTASERSAPNGTQPTMSAAALARVDDEFLTGRPPGQHFRHRLRLLMLTLEQERPHPVAHGRLTLPPEHDGDHVFVHLEAIPLLHQAAEAAWSLLHAVGPDTGSPSLYLARLTTQQLRSRTAAARADADLLDSLIQYTLLLDPSAPHADPDYRQAAMPRVSAVRRILLLAAARLDEDRRVHNAIKHGFAVTAPRAEIGFSLTDPRTAPASPAASATRRTTKGASCCTAPPAGPREHQRSRPSTSDPAQVRRAVKR